MVTERYHDRQEGLYEGFCDVVHEERLEGACALWEDRTGRVRVFEILRDRVYVREDDRVGLSERAGWIDVCVGNAGRVEDRGEGVDRSAIGAGGGGRCVDRAQRFFDIWELDPTSAVREAFVV